jgi:hypothetical protein
MMRRKSGRLSLKKSRDQCPTVEPKKEVDVGLNGVIVSIPIKIKEEFCGKIYKFVIFGNENVN